MLFRVFPILDHHCPMFPIGAFARSIGPVMVRIENHVWALFDVLVANPSYLHVFPLRLC
jgi:hypothetical protein